jgi:hypothetical protein
MPLIGRDQKKRRREEVVKQRKGTVRGKDEHDER